MGWFDAIKSAEGSDRRSKSTIPVSDIWPLLRAAFERP